MKMNQGQKDGNCNEVVTGNRNFTLQKIFKNFLLLND